MIAYLKGNVVSIDEEACILDVGGVGYYVYCPQQTLQKLGKQSSSEIKLYTRLIHREDSMELYGFISRDEYLLFNLLITVSGIGPRQSIKILGTRNVQDIVKAVVSEDSNFLMSLAGIGKKKAQQIILELREKVKKSFDTEETPVSSLYIEAITALESLGFSPSESRKAVDKVLITQENTDDVGKIVENALRYLS